MLPTGSSLYQSWMTQKERNTTRIYSSALPQGSLPKSAEESLVSVWKEASNGRQGVCVIENASPAVVALLRDVWNLEEEFFVEHATNSDASELWQPLWRQSKILSQAKWQTLEGIYEYHGMTLSIDAMKFHNTSYCERHLFQNGHWPVNSTTRMSYIRVLPSLCRRAFYEIYGDHLTDSSPRPVSCGPADTSEGNPERDQDVQSENNLTISIL